MLRDLEFKPSYSKSEDDIASLFYIPAMKCAARYDRISGYFGSTIYIIAWDAMKQFIENRGKMRLICSPLLTDEDQEAIDKGYHARNDSVIYDAIMREVEHMFHDQSLAAPTKLLAYLVAEGIIDVKLAVVGTKTSPQIRRLFHDKVGVFIDENHDAVGFRGSMNETYKGLASDGNIESIDVFPSWVDERDQKRVEDAQRQFDELWDDCSTGVSVFEFPEAVRSVLRQKTQNCNWPYLLDEVKRSNSLAEKWCANKERSGKKPRPHQIKALESWVANGRRGILEHATGSGKTYTAMCAIRNAIDRGDSVLVLVPSIDLLNQWADEIQDNIPLPNLRCLLCGGGHNEWRKPGILRSWSQKHPDSKAIILSTMDTAVTNAFLSQITQGDQLFIVGDEVHRLGSSNRQKIFGIRCGSCLGLSATPIRYGDPEGTRAILDFFGGILQPPFTLQDAINTGVLTRYFYYPITTQMSADEQEKWDKLTKEISTIVARTLGGSKNFKNIMLTPQLKAKILARARIVKNASAKIYVALDVINRFYRDDQKWIVYCDNQKQLGQVLNVLMENGYDAYKYHSEMAGDRKQTLAYFESNGGILVSIRCLDEGVDIPSTTHALILASSQNPREFIQRRGRILRKSPNKHYAYLFDVLVLPNRVADECDEIGKALSIVESELARAIQFGEMAENPSCIAKLKNIAVDFDININEARDGGFEDGEE